MYCILVVARLFENQETVRSPSMKLSLNNNNINIKTCHATSTRSPFVAKRKSKHAQPSKRQTGNLKPQLQVFRFR